MAGREGSSVAQVEASLAKDCVPSLSVAIQQLGLSIDGFYDWSTKQGVQQRDLLAMAAAACAPACVAALLGAGADPNSASPSDGNTALHCACSSASSSTARIIALLVRGGADKLLPNRAGRTPCELLTLETAQAAQAHEAPLPEECGDLLRPEYSTDDFRMFSFKIDCCPRLAESHDWTLCPFQHPGEKARRRDPRCNKYQGLPCPDFRKGTCKRGDACTFAHGVFECWLHPSRYRTQLCKEGAACRRSVCFFAHAVDQLREPTMTGPVLSQPGSPRGPLLPAEESQDTPRSWSPTCASSEDSVRLLGSSAELYSKFGCGSAPQYAQYGRRPHPLACSADSGVSSLSSTPVLESSMAAASMASGGDSLCLMERTLSNLSLTSEDMSQAVALQHAAAGGYANHAALLAATAAAGGWQFSHSDAMALAAAHGGGPLGAGLHSMHSMLLPDAATVQAAVQAAAMQHQLSVYQAGAAAAGGASGSLLGGSAAGHAGGSGTASLLAAAAGGRPALHPLSLNLGTNLGHPHYNRHHHHSYVPSCYAGGM